MVFAYLDIFDSDKEHVADLKERYQAGGLGDVKIKRYLNEVLEAELGPIRERRAEFEKDIKDGLFLEWARVHGNYYGTSLKPVLEALNNDKIVVFDIDVQGYFLAQKKYAQQITSVFLTTKNATQLENRLKNRASETQESIKERLKNASKEMEYIDKYDYIIINDDVNKAYDELRAIFISICLKSSNIKADEFVKIWNNKG